jgi:hypothetical protein
MAQRPTSVTRAIQLLLGLVVAGLVVTVLVVVLHDDLQDAWSAGHPADSAIEPLEFVPVTIVLYVVIALLVLTLIPLFRSGANWARYALAAIVVLIAISTVAVIRTDPPTIFIVLSIGGLVLDAAIELFLWHPDTSRFLREEASAIDA